MEIILKGVAKKYGAQWIFRNVDFHFENNEKYALIGSNGAGKSTLLKIIIGKIPLTKGTLKYIDKDGKTISPDEVYKYVSIATTSMSLIEEFTLKELLKFHFKFRKPIQALSIDEVLQILELEKEKNKFVRDFSSGMAQRLKIGLAILSQSSILVLDEPGANLDEASKHWYYQTLNKYLENRTLIIASNEASDYKACGKYLNISEFA